MLWEALRKLWGSFGEALEGFGRLWDALGMLWEALEGFGEALGRLWEALGEGSAVSVDLTTAEATARSAAQLRRVWKDTSPVWGLGTAAEVWE